MIILVLSPLTDSRDPACSVVLYPDTPPPPVLCISALVLIVREDHRVPADLDFVKLPPL